MVHHFLPSFVSHDTNDASDKSSISMSFLSMLSLAAYFVNAADTSSDLPLRSAIKAVISGEQVTPPPPPHALASITKARHRIEISFFICVCLFLDFLEI